MSKEGQTATDEDATTSANTSYTDTTPSTCAKSQEYLKVSGEASAPNPGDAGSNSSGSDQESHGVMLRHWLGEPPKNAPWTVYNAGRAKVEDEAADS